MQVVSVCSTKGGAGKTTLASALAVAAAQDGLRVALIDIDPQQSLASWWLERGKPDNPELRTWPATKGVKFIVTAIERIADDHDLLIIDTPPAIMSIVEIGVLAGDFILIPAQASAVDLKANEDVLKMVQKYDKDFAFVINRAEARDTMVGEAIAILKESGPVMSVTIGNRKAFRAAIGEGKTGAEVDTDKAKKEIATLWAGVKKHLRAQTRKVA